MNTEDVKKFEEYASEKKKNLLEEADNINERASRLFDKSASIISSVVDTELKHLDTLLDFFKNILTVLITGFLATLALNEIQNRLIIQIIISVLIFICITAVYMIIHKRKAALKTLSDLGESHVSLYHTFIDGVRTNLKYNVEDMKALSKEMDEFKKKLEAEILKMQNS